MIAIAPGKAVLSGEYAVLHGAPAFAVAVDRYAVARLAKDDTGSPFIAAAMQAAARHLGVDLPAGAITVDTSLLYAGGRKLGLGSSAAVTVATMGLAWAASGRSLTDRQTLLRLAAAAHDQAQGRRGSGIDVATSLWGGLLRYRLENNHPEVTPASLPAGIELTLLATGESASTPKLLASVGALGPARILAVLGEPAAAFDAAMTSGGTRALIAAVERYRQGMATLGLEAGSTIVTAEHERIAELARRAGGAAKPSGAGGGDLAVAFTVGAEATSRLRAELARAGFHPLMGAPAPGLRLETP